MQRIILSLSAVALMLASVSGADAPPPVFAAAEKQYAVAITRANQAYARAIAQADKNYIAQLTALRNRAQGDDAVTIDAIKDLPQKDLDSNDQIAKATVVLLPAPPVDPVAEKLKAALAEIDRLKGMLGGSDSISAASGATIITLKQLENMGERYTNKPVSIVHVEFLEPSQTFIDDLPGVTVSTDGLLSYINRKESEKWIGLLVRDGEGGRSSMLFASKADYGDFLVGLKRQTVISVSGTVVAMDNHRFGLICTKIERVPDATPPPVRK